jgi:hypothetical protein
MIDRGAERTLFDALRREPAVDPDALVRLRAALVREAARGRPRRIVLSLANAVFAVLLVALLTSAIWSLALRSFGDADAAAARTPVQFVLVAEGAERVSLVGDFNDWDRDATPMTKAGSVWSVIVQLERGRFTYAFLVDGEQWRADPAAIPAGNDFDRPASVVFVNGGKADL